MNYSYDTYESRVCLIHPGEDATDVPALFLNHEAAVLSDPTAEYSLMISREGTAIQGPLSIAATPDQWRIAGLWKVNQMVTAAIPSTLYTPTPWLQPSVPRVNKVMTEGFISVAVLFAALLS